MVEVEILGQVITAQYGTLNSGARLRTSEAFAKHLVVDCNAAKYTEVNALVAMPSVQIHLPDESTATLVDLVEFKAIPSDAVAADPLELPLTSAELPDAVGVIDAGPLASLPIPVTFVAPDDGDSQTVEPLPAEPAETDQVAPAPIMAPCPSRKPKL